MFSSMVELFLLLENLTVSGRLTGVEGVLLAVSLVAAAAAAIAAAVVCAPPPPPPPELPPPTPPLSAPASTIQLDRLDFIMYFPPLPAGGLLV